MLTIGQKIKMLRTNLNFTQDELAFAANTTKQTIHKYETGIISNIPASKIKAIADKLQTTPAYLMGWEEENSKLYKSGYTINDIANELDIPIDVLTDIIKSDNVAALKKIIKVSNIFSKQNENHISNFKISSQEQAHIKKYRNLDDYGKRVVDVVLDEEYRRCSNFQMVARGGATEAGSVDPDEFEEAERKAEENLAKNPPPEY